MDSRDGRGRLAPALPLIRLLILSLLLPLHSIEAAEVDSETCLGCHDDYDASLAVGPHRLGDDGATSIKQVSCGSCHRGGEVHIEDPATTNITNFRGVPIIEQAEICSQCHMVPHQTAMLGTDRDSRFDLGCGNCHQVHDNPNPHLNRGEQDNYCLSCHSNVVAEFKRRSAHPLESGNIRCVDCHELGLAGDPIQKVGLDWKCQSCHADLAGPFIHEHEVVNRHTVDGGGCAECHMPHGSPNDRLLKQPGSLLCNSCHGVPPLHRVRHGGIAMRLECVDCHTQIHGSSDSHLYLDPMLASKLGAVGLDDCEQAGCHDLKN